MTDSVLVCVEDPTLARHTVAMVHEIGGFDTTPAETFREMRDALARHGAAVVLLHEDFGPLPLPDLLRELTADHPLSAPVVLAREPTAPFVRAAMEAGARAVVELPLALEDLELRMSAAATWSAALRRQMSTVDGEAVMPPQARMVAVAGAKGGVGTTTVAVQLALAAAPAADPERRVCLVDLDLQTGDVPATLGIAPGRSIADLVEAADGLTQRSIEDSLFAHPSGLRVLLGPAEGERQEDVTEHLSREVLGGLRSRSGVVVVDCGAVTTEASAVAVEMADVVLLVATTDVPCLRAAKRLLRLWSRLEVCKPDEVLLVINRASRRDEVQPRLAGMAGRRRVPAAADGRADPRSAAGLPGRRRRLRRGSDRNLRPHPPHRTAGHIHHAPALLPRGGLRGPRCVTRGSRRPDARCPHGVVTNAELERSLGEPVDEWLVGNVGIRERRVMADGETTSDLAARAGRQCLERAGRGPADLDLVVVATDTPDFLSLATAAVVAVKLGAPGVPAFDVNCACAGWVTALDTASRRIATDPRCDLVLVVGAYGMTRFLDWSDKHTATLFADGAGAVLLEAGEAPGFLAGRPGADGSYHDALGIFTGGAAQPATLDAVRHGGRPRVEFARKIPGTFNQEHWPPLVRRVVADAGLTLNAVDLFLFTQLNLRTIETVMAELGQPLSKTHWVMDRFGYTGSACIPMALDDAVQKGRLRAGDQVVFCASGGGIALAAAVVRWTLDAAGGSAPSGPAVPGGSP